MSGVEARDRILRDQGYEMVELMRRACFFGREGSLGEYMIKAEEVEFGDEVEREREMATRAGEWIKTRQEIEEQEKGKPESW